MTTISTRIITAMVTVSPALGSPPPPVVDPAPPPASLPTTPQGASYGLSIATTTTTAAFGLIFTVVSTGAYTHELLVLNFSTNWRIESGSTGSDRVAGFLSRLVLWAPRGAC